MNKLINTILPYWVIGYYAFWNSTIVSRLAVIAGFASLYILAFFVLLTNWRRIFLVLSKDPLISIFILFGAFSVFWSIMPSITVASSRSFIVQYILVGFIVATNKPEKIIAILAQVLSFVALLSLIYIIFIPEVGRSGDANYGIYAHQSSFAQAMALCTLCLLYQFLLKQRAKENILALSAISVTGLVSFFMILISGAKTSLVAFLAAFSVLPLYFLGRIKGVKDRTLIFVATVYFFILTITTVFVMRKIIIVDVLGKSLDFTGRSTTWEFMLSKLSESPFLGYGLDAFWHSQKLHNEYQATLERPIPFPYNSHNAYWDILIGIGPLGLFLFFLFIAGVVRRNLTLLLWYKDLEALWGIQIAIFLLIASYSDVTPSPLRVRSIGAVIFGIIALISQLKLDKVTKRKLTTANNPYTY